MLNVSIINYSLYWDMEERKFRMKSKLMKKIMAVVCASAFFVGGIANPVHISAAAKNEKAKKAYVKLVKKLNSNKQKWDTYTYQYYDFNKDGIDELVVCLAGGARGLYDVYTYRNNKVVEIVSSENGIGYLKGNKYIVGFGSGGAGWLQYTVYKMTKSGKAKSIETYNYEEGTYKHNGKKTKESVYTKFEKKVKWDLGKSYKVKTASKKYYSPKQLGIKIYDPDRKKYTKVVKTANNKVYYYYYKLGEDGITAWKSKTKTAKITSKSKFYYGDVKRVLTKDIPGTSEEDKKWIYKISKKTFISKMKNYNDAMDNIIVKNGKLQRVIIHIQTAG